MSNTLLQRGSKYLFIYSRNLVYSCRLAVAHKESCNNIVCEEKEFNLALGEKNSVKPFSSSVCHQLQPNLTAFPPTAFLSRAFIFFSIKQLLEHSVVWGLNSGKFCCEKMKNFLSLLCPWARHFSHVGS